MKVNNLREHINLQAVHFGRSVVVSADSSVLFLYSFQPGQSMTDHTHPFASEFLLVIEGQALISVGTESVLADPQSVVGIPPEAVHSIHNQGSKPLLVASFMSPKP
jgi:quercetin dioxygenase-like cupin family protein